MYVEYIPVFSIKLDEFSRIRKDLGDISSLAQSIEKNGLINPIVLTKDFELIAGHRRLIAIKKLGWEKIPAMVLPYKMTRLELLNIEMEENLHRKEFTPIEMATYNKRKYKYVTPLYKRGWHKIGRFFKLLWIKLTRRLSFKKGKK